jgi:hypothetical protein
MDHAARMGVIDRVANVEEAAEEFAQLEVTAAANAGLPLTRPSGTLSP